MNTLIINTVKKKYPSGKSYFTDNGKGCTDHGENCSYNVESQCNCKIFGSAIQCKGFSGYVFYQLFGVYLPPYDSSRYKLVYDSNVKSVGILDSGSVTASSLRTLFSTALPGDQIQGRSQYSQHSMIVEFSTDWGVHVYEANVDGKCGVGERDISYESLANTYRYGLSLNRATNYGYTDTHTHNYKDTWHEGVHPHREYVACSCGATKYTGNTVYISSCSLCCTPEAISIKASMTNVKIDNTVKFDFEYKNAEWAAIVIRKDGVNKHVETVTGKTTYSHKFTEVGHYDVHLELWNGDEYSSTKAINGGINVYNAKPSNVTIEASSTYITSGDNVDFTFTQKDATYWYCEVYKDNNEIHSELLTGKYNYSYTFDEGGVYEVYLKAANDYGWTEPSVMITVSSTPEKPELKPIKPYYLPDTPIVFEWDDTGATTHYNLHIHKQGSI